MSQPYPLTPPLGWVLDLLNEARKRAKSEGLCGPVDYVYMVNKSAQMGWDQRGATTEAELQQARDEELKGCEEWVADKISVPEAAELRAARRPTPPSLKDQALEAARRFYAQGHEGCTDEEVKDDFDAICRALRRLEELEAAQ